MTEEKAAAERKHLNAVFARVLRSALEDAEAEKLAGLAVVLVNREGGTMSFSVGPPALLAFEMEKNITTIVANTIAQEQREVEKAKRIITPGESGLLVPAGRR